ncbi:unnamed protein product [Auanema sp. JU1783]|nr:unnamed protein product [Auanema sp. JU1783]
MDSKTYTVRSINNQTPYLVEPVSYNRQYHAQPVRRAVVLSNNQQTPRMNRIQPPPHSAPQCYRSLPPGGVLKYEYDFADAKRNIDKSKGLRHFSTKVCEKVKEKGRTNYNEVADELVAEYFDSQSSVQFNDEKHQYDMKNIRRRVYDALNVLLAMNIIQKNKKDIHWVGLPTSTVQEYKRLEEEKVRRQERIREKTNNLHEMIVQLVAYKTLVERNRERERTEGRPVDNSVLYLPYVIVNTEKRALVECSVAHDKSEFLFNFDHPFEIHDDVEVLKRLGLAFGLEKGRAAPGTSEKIKSCLPPALREYVDEIIQSGAMMVDSPSVSGISSVNVGGKDKSVQYILSTPEEEKPQLVRPIRNPVVVRSANRYTVVKPSTFSHIPQPKRYQQVVVRPNGSQRVMLANQSSGIHLTRPLQNQFRSQPAHYTHYEQPQASDSHGYMYEEIEGEENIDYS